MNKDVKLIYNFVCGNFDLHKGVAHDMTNDELRDSFMTSASSFLKIKEFIESNFKADKDG